ncbi:hypothetical protein I6N90_13380 [Paenibacillus sp. GSMTC-2017]|uniref:hypothetical protein n=1 Tax=Paenibacillus sp. GSMTC-2017 TaxID=2794350 RepID=UPI0018D78ED1|nr:hypothetical protein [Paenibacillus sp. GSMTC-2017]MBH5318793.1 hypothetical protein [Paenibacillus sp. GSMTC-2017]
MNLSVMDYVKATAIGLIMAVIVSGINIGIASAISWYNGNPPVDIFSVARLGIFGVVFVFVGTQYLFSKQKSRG